MADHDEFCPGSTNECICVSLRRARADERARVINDAASVEAVARRAAEVIHADLHARVEALPVPGYLDAALLLHGSWRRWRRDVLALIDGSE